MGQYAIYLRKSRADVEAEARGEGETLARHRTALYALAERRGLNVVKEYAEIMTGESIEARPQMKQLLEDVRAGMYDGVIVNDVDRLGRGGGADQERIKIIFRVGRCKIITPTRDIDPESPYDEDMLDMNMYFSQYELRKISWRLMQGRIRSVESGNYINSRIPFGYKQIKDGKKITLIPDPEKAPIVQWMFDEYASGRSGIVAISNKLTDMGVLTTRGYNFSKTGVKRILENPVYVGTLVWGKTKTISTFEGEKKVKRSITNDNAIIVEDAHEPIVSREIFDRVQTMFNDQRHNPRVNTAKKLANPLAGLVVCAKCGRTMLVTTCKRGRTLYCRTYGCPTVGVSLQAIEDELVNILRQWCVDYADVPEEQTEVDKKQTDVYTRQLEQLRNRLANVRRFVETGLYSPAEYIEQRDMLQRSINAIQREMTEKAAPTVTQSINAMIPEIEKVIDAYPYAETNEQKNALLKSIIVKVDYEKSTRIYGNRHNPMEGVKLVVYPKIVL